MDWRDAFLDLAMQYYIAGRSAAMCGLVPVCGNLLHHAVEMFLKAGLVNVLKPEEMARRPYSHSLTALWGRYKVEQGDPGLAGFDATIQALDPFESIRYPDEIVRRGFHISVAWRPGDVLVRSGTGSTPPVYGLPINDIDAMAIDTVKRAKVSARYLTMNLSKRESREALQYINPHAADWL
jgi:hypothetical protein